jgi:hypothetical protein
MWRPEGLKCLHFNADGSCTAQRSGAGNSKVSSTMEWTLAMWITPLDIHREVRYEESKWAQEPTASLIML